MARARSADPLAGRTRLVIDGSNQRDRTGVGEPPPEEALVGSLRALFPSTISIVVVFDTDAPIGSASLRAVAGVTVRHAGAGGGDDLVCAIASQAPERTLVITDDNDLRDRISELGARTEHNDWLRQRRQRGRPAIGSIGRRTRSSRSPQEADASADSDPDRTRWRPGRGATAKRGNPRRLPKRR